MNPDVLVGAYFYPQTSHSTDRFRRGMEVFGKIGMEQFFEPANEFELARTAPPLFDGHDQPRSYCFPGNLRTEWDDYHDGDLAVQCAIAQRHGLSYFVLDSYNGVQDGREQHEFSEPLDQINRLARHTPLGLHGFKYAKMETLESSRVVLPIPARGRREYSNSYAEPDRSFDVSPETARVIVASSLRHWRNERDYLFVHETRPYISVLMPPFHGRETDAAIQTKLNDFINALRDEAVLNGYLPYIVGVMRTTGEVDSKRWIEAGVDAITEYCNLVYHGSDAEPIQQYADLINERRLGWEALKGGVPYMPSPAVGWDASPRGERGYTWEEVQGVHPYTPIAVGGTPELFGGVVRDAITYARQAAPTDPSERLVTIFAWNEVGEGAVLIPRLRADGTADASYLESVKAACAAGSSDLAASV
jgi:hypothetical protein